MSAAVVQIPAPPQRPLPPLRRDIVLEPVTDSEGGFPALVVTDPVRGSYFRLTWPQSAILLHWQDAASVEELQGLLLEVHGLDVPTEGIAEVAEFAFAGQLTVADAQGGWQRYAAIQKAGKHGFFKWILHSYLFFRMPLFHPQMWLQRVLPYVSFAYTRAFWGLLAVAALVGIYLATRQWSALITAVHEAARFEALLLHAVAIIGLKGIHELGHALTTVRYGCRVPSMGVAVMLGAPVLYTDTSDSWRLSQRSERLAIVFAGVAAEMIVATISILLWVFLPDGTARQICFSLATASIVLSLAVNLNPFMRFDGYFALSDYLQVPNLQPRAFALATWRMREALFGLGQPPPETVPRGLRRILVGYAFLTWIYRLGLYLGIAAVVYAMAGKAVGILLGGFEIAVFIARPVVEELGQWWQMRAAIARRSRAHLTGAVAAALLALLCLPWLGTVEAPSVLVAGAEEAVHMPFPARLLRVEVKQGQRVAVGAVLFRADSSDLDRQYGKASIERRALELQLGRLHSSDKELETRLILQSKLAQARERMASIEKQRQQLVVRAPVSGIVVDLDAEVSPGNWLSPKLPLVRIVSEGAPKVRGLVSENDVARLTSGASATFVGEDPTQPPRELRLVALSAASDGRLTEAVLADRHGGAVAAGDERGELRTRAGWFEATFEADGARPPQLVRGTTLVAAEAVSPMHLLWRQVSRVLVREQGF